MNTSLNFRKILFIGLLLPAVTLSYSCWKRPSSPMDNQTVNKKKVYVNQHIEEDVVSLVEHTDLFLNEMKLKRYNQSMYVSLKDTIQNIYLVRLTQEIGDSSKVLGDFLVDANRMVILNPDGKSQSK